METQSTVHKTYLMDTQVHFAWYVSFTEHSHNLLHSCVCECIYHKRWLHKLKTYEYNLTNPSVWLTASLSPKLCEAARVISASVIFSFTYCSSEWQIIVLSFSLLYITVFVIVCFLSWPVISSFFSLSPLSLCFFLSHTYHCPHRSFVVLVLSQLADRHPVPQKEAISIQLGAIVVSNRMDLEVKRELLIQLTEAEEKRRKKMNKVDENGRLLTPCSEKERRNSVSLMLVYKAVWLMCSVSSWTGGGKRGEFMNNKGFGADFILLPQLIKDWTC